MNLDNGGPAFPQKEPLMSDAHGISIRDYFAAKAMQAFIGEAIIPNRDEFYKQIAIYAYAMADAMLAERDREAT